MRGDIAMLGVMRLLISQLAAFLALLLLAAAVHKAIRWPQTRRVVRDFAGIPRSASSVAALAAAVGETLAGVLLFVPAYRAAGAALAALLWGAYSILIVRAIVEGRRDVDCGCSFGPNQRPLGVFQVARNAMLVILALLVAVSAAGGGVPVAASQILAACALLALYGALDQVMALQPLRRGELL
jgi:uncharacterized membrane protein YphA (DoxX/SURF4 family)